jgi:hypothetical protein
MPSRLSAVLRAASLSVAHMECWPVKAHIIALMHITFLLGIGSANAFSVTDCVLGGMKGVSSDVAARQIRWACDQKYQEHKRKRLQEFGEILERSSFIKAPNWDHEGPGFHKIQFTNGNSDKTITYVRLRVAPAEDQEGPCDTGKAKRHAYKLFIKPGATISFAYPSTNKSECINVDMVVGRPPSWRDLSLSSLARPEDSDPLTEFDP